MYMTYCEYIWRIQGIFILQIILQKLLKVIIYF